MTLLLDSNPHIWTGNTKERNWRSDVNRPEMQRSVRHVENVFNPSVEELVKGWIRIAMFHAVCRPTQDPVGFIASIVGVEGAWGFGETRDDALQELESVLTDWVDLKMGSGDNDIPKMEHINLAYAMA